MDSPLTKKRKNIYSYNSNKIFEHKIMYKDNFNWQIRLQLKLAFKIRP